MPEWIKWCCELGSSFGPLAQTWWLVPQKKGSRFPLRLAWRNARASAKAEGNSLDRRFAEAILQAVEDFFPVVAEDLVKPSVVIDGDKQGAVFESRRLCVSGDPGVNGAGPDAWNFSLAFLLLEIEIGNEVLGQRGNILGPVTSKGLGLRGVDPTPCR